MKKYIISLFAVAGLLVSCDIQIDNLFDENSSRRIDEQVAEAIDRITSAQNGWVIEYYPNPDQAYGGVNILVKFNEDSTVEMINDTASDLTAVKKSTYKIDRYQGAVLAFDTDNEYISYYADPSVTEGGGSRYGFLGDMEFAIKEMSDTEIVMMGTKTLNKIIMRPMPATTTWEQYLAKVQAIQEDYFYMISLTLHYGDKTQQMTVDAKYPILLYDIAVEGGIDTYGASYIYTDTGIKLYEPMELYGLSMQNFTWDPATLQMRCTDPGAESVYIEGAESPYLRRYDYFIGEWTFYCADRNGNSMSYDVTISEKEYRSTLLLEGLFVQQATHGEFRYPITLTWSRDGRVEILCPQQVGRRDFTVGGVTYRNCAVMLRSGRAGSTNSTSNSGMISKTDMHENFYRIDFVNNGKNATGTGLAYYSSDGTPSSITAGYFLEPMFMVKKQ